MGGGGQNTVTTQELAPEQRQLLEGVIPIAENFLQNPPQQYQGTGIVGFNPLQRQAQRMTLNAAGNIGQTVNRAQRGLLNTTQGFGQLANQAENQAGNVFQRLQQPSQLANQGARGTQQSINQMVRQGNNQTAAGLGYLTDPSMLNPDNNAYLQQATQAAIRPALQNFQNVILPSIGNEAITAGGYGGTRQQIAEGLAAQGLGQNIADISANMYSNAYGQGLNAMNQGLSTAVNQQGQNMNAQLGAGGLTQQAANTIMQGRLGGMNAQNAYNQTAQGALGAQMQGYQAMPQLAQQSLLPAQLTSMVGEQQQALEQARLNETIQRFVNNQMLPFAAAQDVAALAFGIPAGQTTSHTSGGSAGVLPMIQGGLGIASMLPALFALSDRRLKTNVRVVGKLSDGLNVYSFGYVYAPNADCLGLMADEVAEVYPEAVALSDSGFFAVNYSAVPTWSESCFRS